MVTGVAVWRQVPQHFGREFAPAAKHAGAGPCPSPGWVSTARHGAACGTAGWLKSMRRQLAVLLDMPASGSVECRSETREGKHAPLLAIATPPHRRRRRRRRWCPPGGGRCRHLADHLQGLPAAAHFGLARSRHPSRPNSVIPGIVARQLPPAVRTRSHISTTCPRPPSCDCPAVFAAASAP